MVMMMMMMMMSGPFPRAKEKKRCDLRNHGGELVECRFLGQVHCPYWDLGGELFELFPGFGPGWLVSAPFGTGGRTDYLIHRPDYWITQRCWWAWKFSYRENWPGIYNCSTSEWWYAFYTFSFI